MEFLGQYGLFLAQVVTLVVAVLVILGFAVGISARQQNEKGSLKVTDLSEKYTETQRSLQMELASESDGKKLKKSFDKADKAKQKGDQEAQARLFVLDFKGGIDAKEVNALREEITGVLSIAGEGDEVFIRLESGGGAVHAYGLAAAQLQRLRDAGLTLTVAVDKVAASGGYMMACVGHKILAAPFALVGSIGVIGQIPNFNKLLKKSNIEFEQHTAGEYKRTLTMFGENDNHGRDKFKQDLEQIHHHFKTFVVNNRPQMDIEKVATGEYWLGTEAQELGLVDELMTTDSYLMHMYAQKQVIAIQYKLKKTLKEKLNGLQTQVQQNLLQPVFDVGRRFMS